MTNKSKIDYSRNSGLLSQSLLKDTHLTFVGTGGAANLVCNMARIGVGEISIVEFDIVSKTNPATQGFGVSEIGEFKADALKVRIKEINPSTKITIVKKRYQDLSASELTHIWSANIVMAMTDSFECQKQINKDAIKKQTDAIFAICYIGCEAIEVTGTFPSELAQGYGCHRCHTKARYDAYAKDGFENPDTIPSHIFAAEALNNLLGLLTVSRLHHQKKNELPIANLATEFVKEPCLIQRIGGPNYWSNKGEPFAMLNHTDRLFNTKIFELDTPQNWVCPDCRTLGVVPKQKTA